MNANDNEILCNACGYSGTIDTYDPCLTSMWNDCRCPKCGSTSNKHNEDYQKDVRKAIDESKIEREEINIKREKLNLNTLAERVHLAHIAWWQNPVTGKPIERNRGELLALVITELAEAIEGERKNLRDDHLPYRMMAEVEMADAKIRLLDFAGGFGYRFLREGKSHSYYRSPYTNKAERILEIITVVTKIWNGPGYFILDALDLIELYCKDFGYDLQGAFEEKLAYNARREDHKHEARRADGGKKF
jgi:hypothetical protein